MTRPTAVTNVSAGSDSARSGAPSGGGHAVLGAAGGVAGLTLVSRALGFLRWIVQATTVGAGTVAGAYATANQVPNVLYEVVVGGALAATVVPLLAGPVSAGRDGEVSRTTSALLALVLLVLTPLALVLALCARPIAGWFPVSQGVDPELQRGLVAAFLRMFAAQVPLYGIGVVLTGVLQAHGRFTWPALTPVLSSLVVMATYAVYGALAAGAETASPVALQVLGWGTTAGVAALSLPLLWPAHRLGIRLRPTLRLGRGTAAKALRLGGAGVWTLVAQQVSVLAVLALARAGGSTGTVAVYQYTQAVYVLPYAVLVVPVATVVYPRLAAAFTRDGDDARRLTARSTALVTGVAVAGGGMLLAAADGAERFFSLLADVAGMGASLALLAPGLVGYALIYQVTRALYAADRARGAALAAAAGWVTVALASWAAVSLLAPHGGDGVATLKGLALGTTAGMCVAGVGLLAALACRMGTRVLAPTAQILAATLPVAAAAGAACNWLSRQAGTVVGAMTVAGVGAILTAAATLAAICAVDREIPAALRRRPARPGVDDRAAADEHEAQEWK
ncbi:putative peptidoglycan lipid II flippase [Actinomyces ruminicola]|uniref:Putative peptidoglycan lipid II flippase n=1 Tax=Actinomyces ruminicola TaxID=332524 RepID=A0A1H0D9F6_9ACTO|nr:putative peptidoglycan lipid II flippase [Actinomyces ruminicola]